MEMIAYISNTPLEGGSFLERNPAMCYLLVYGTETKQTVLIDAGCSPGQIIRDLDERGLSLDYILLTHTHMDHTFSLAELIKRYPAVKTGVHPYSVQHFNRQGYKGAFPLEDGMLLPPGNDELTVLYTPGHTTDSVSFLDEREKLFFSGDTLFGGGIGCSDYRGGGNRNIFYQTIVDLLNRLSPQTDIYPGHYSEHYRVYPPYPFSEEALKNPYITAALKGRRGDFDRYLKEFSIEFETDDYKMLSTAEIARICQLESKIWIPALQAPRETILKRLGMGHQILAIEEKDDLLGMIAWRYSAYSGADSPDRFPRKFDAFSTEGSCEATDARSAFIYSLGVKAGSRTRGTGKYLLQRAFDRIRAFGVNEIFVDARLPSYKGSSQSPHETIEFNPAFKEAIDRYFTGNIFPGAEELALDPIVRFYLKNGFRPWLILKDFINDQHSGNMRIICRINLEQAEG